MKLRCIIIDDEYLARQRIMTLLKPHTNILVVAECRNGRDALAKIQMKEPDFIFLDIQMPDLDGFAVLEKLPHIPYVIFTTAYDQFALKAFEINAVDYLLKPFDQERLDTSIARMVALKKKEQAAVLKQQLSALFNTFQQEEPQSLSTQFDIKKNGRIISVPSEHIVYIKSDGNYLELHTEEGKYLYRATLNAVQGTLSSTEFIRIHRSLLVQKRYVHQCNYTGNSRYKVRLKTGEDLLSGRSYKAAVVAFLEERE